MQKRVFIDILDTGEIVMRDKLFVIACNVGVVCVCVIYV